MKIDEIAELKTMVTELDSKLAHFKEKNESQARELRFKADQLKELESRLAKTNDELDMTKYKLQDLQKEITEIKLKSDVLTSANDGLVNEKEHLVIELKETRDLQLTYIST